MADIFTEVEEELRRDKYNTLLRRYGLWVLGAAVLIVVAAGLHQMAWQPWRQSQSFALSDSYASAVAMREAGQDAAADAALGELAETAPRGYAALALLERADLAAEAGELSRAAALYGEAAETADDVTISGLARIKALYAIADEAAYDEILARAEPLAVAESPYRSSARELIAAAALRAGDLARARSEYQYLSLAPETPSGIRTRADEGLAAVARAEATQSQSVEDAPS